jgi:hypothetical protein
VDADLKSEDINGVDLGNFTHEQSRATHDSQIVVRLTNDSQFHPMRLGFYFGRRICLETSAKKIPLLDDENLGSEYHLSGPEMV